MESFYKRDLLSSLEDIRGSLNRLDYEVEWYTEEVSKLEEDLSNQDELIVRLQSKIDELGVIE